MEDAVKPRAPESVQAKVTCPKCGHEHVVSAGSLDTPQTPKMSFQE